MKQIEFNYETFLESVKEKLTEKFGEFKIKTKN